MHPTAIHKDNISIADLNKGHTAAFDMVFRHYYASLCYFAEKIVGSKGAAEDVVQSVFLGFYERKPIFENSIALRSYLYRAANNQSLKLLSKQRRNISADEQLPDPGTDIEKNHHFVLEADIVEEIFHAIGNLPLACRRIFEMSYVERHSIKEISEILNISENTVKTQRQRAKKMLREKLNNLYRHITFIFL